MTDQSVVLPKDGSRPGTPWWIRSTSFVVSDGPQTYDMDAVLRLREAMAVAVESWKPVTPVIAAAGLTATAGSGCDAAAVNQWLGMVRAAMHEDGTAPAQAAPSAPRPTTNEAAPPPAAATARPAARLGGEDNAAVVQRINDARFTPLRFRHGYVMTEVDDFLDHLVAAVSAGESIAGLVTEVRFNESRMRECYLIEDVEKFLLQLVKDHEGVLVARSLPAAEASDA